jgi:glycerate 2-kinase
MLFKNYDQLMGNGQTPALAQKRKDVLEMLAAAVETVDPYLVVERVFQEKQLVLQSETVDVSTFDHVYVVGFGKASVGMAQAVCDSVSVTKGVVVTNNSTATISRDSVEVIVGGHPLPAEGSVRGAEKIISLFQGCTENDCVIVLISGGGSALFEKPRVPFEDLQQTTDLLLRSGVGIEDFNTIRKHLSQVKGGQLAGYTKGFIISLIISDIVNDPVSSIASGPTSPDPTTFSDAKKILTRYKLWEKIPMTVRMVIEDGIGGRIPETLKENNPVFQRVLNYVVANNELACHAAVKKAEELGYMATLLTTSVTGEATEIGSYLIKKVKQSLSPGKTVFIAGGETTVTVQGNGKGGRNQELVLNCVKELAGTEMVVASFATDGVDGNSPAAGALADGFSFARAKKQKLSPSVFLKENNSNEFFIRLDDVLLTGPTGTNVMDVLVFIR